MPLVLAVSATTVLLVILVLTFLVVAQVRFSGGSRPCPSCGRRVRKEKLDCSECGHDFRARDELW